VLVGVLAGCLAQGAAGLPSVVLAMLAPAAALLLLDRRLRRTTQALEAARRSNRLLSQILERAPLELSIKDAEGRYVWLNPEGIRRRALDLDRVIGKTAAEIGIDAVQAANAMAHDQAVLRTGLADGPREQIVYGADGRIRDITSVTKIPILEDGAVACIVSFNVDHTGLRADHIEAEATRRLLETAFEGAPVTMHIVDHSGRMLWANTVFRRYAGFAEESPVGRPLAEMVPDPEILAAVLRANAALLSGEVTQLQLDQRLPATAYRPELHLSVTKVAIPGPRGTQKLILTMGVDVTAQRQAEADAAIHRRLMDSILRYAPLTIQVKDTDLRFCWANDAFCQAVRATRETLLGKTLRDLDLPEASVERNHAIDREVLRTGERTELTQRWTRGKSVRHIMVVKAPILDDDGRPTHIITMGADITDRHRLQAELTESRRQLQLVIDAAPVIIALKDRELRYVLVNQEFMRRVPHQTDEVLGRRVQDIIAEDAFSPEMERQDLELLRTGIEPPSMVLHPVSPDGEVRVFSFRRLAVRDSDGAIDGVLVVGVDVTEQTRAAQELRLLNEELERRVEERARALAEANELVSTVIHSSPVPIVTHRGDGSVSTCNPAAARLTGLAAGLAPIEAVARRILQGEVVEAAALTLADPAGQDVHCLVYGAQLRGADGEIAGAVTIWLDVTDSRRALDALEAMRTSLQDAIEASDHSIVLYDKDDRVVLHNRHFLEHFSELRDAPQVGLKFEDAYRLAAQQGFYQIPDGQDIESFVAERLARRARANGERFLRRHADGRVFEVWENRARNGGLVTMGVDVTEKLKLEQQLLHAQRMEAVGQLTGGVAHDFNNLLGVISLNLDLIQMHVDEDDEVHAFAASALDAITIGATLTKRLIAFARRQTLRPEATDIPALIRGIAPLLQRAVGEPVALSFAFADQPCFAVIDPGQLESALLNLAVNARDAMPQGGQLGIAVRGVVIMTEQPGLAPGEYVEISVTDSGIGIAPAILDRVFEPFFSTKDTGKGSGLGLSMVFGFAKQSGGHVTIASEPGRFTTVTLYFPRLLDETSGRRPDGSAAAPTKPGQGELVLLVEDNAALREATVTVLKRLGYRVVEAEDAAMAREVLARHAEVALVFTDIVLPNGESGIDLAAELRRVRPDLPLLFASGFVAPGDVGGETLPVDAVVLGKPYQQSELAAALRRCLGKAFLF
jgi:PAS domain S-box-containing protein